MGAKSRTVIVFLCIIILILSGAFVYLLVNQDRISDATLENGSAISVQDLNNSIITANDLSVEDLLELEESNPELPVETEPTFPVTPIEEPLNPVLPVEPPSEPVLPLPEEETIICGNLDTNGDNMITLIDFSALASNFGKNCTQLTTAANLNGCGPIDYDLNGKINDIDFDALKTKFGTKCDSDSFVDCGSMDFNLDTYFTITDFSVLASKFNKFCRSAKLKITDGTYACGSLDINLDGKTNSIDFVNFRSRFGKLCAAVQLERGKVVCGGLDWDNDGIIDENDIESMKQFQGLECTDSKPMVNSCGPKDMNSDGKITEQDEISANSKVGNECEQS